MVINAQTRIGGTDLSLKRLASLLVPPLAVMAVIFLLSAQTSDADHPFLEVLLRKLAHVTEYLVLTLAWVRALRGLVSRAPLASLIAAAACISLVYAGTDELHQTFVSGRHGTPVDVLIDSVGAAIACWLVSAQARRRRRTAGAPGFSG
jgi:VanZ family protein